MEKLLHVLGGEDEGHGHSHVHAHATESAVGSSSAVTVPSKDRLHSHKGDDCPPALPCHHGPPLCLCITCLPFCATMPLPIYLTLYDSASLDGRPLDNHFEGQVGHRHALCPFSPLDETEMTMQVHSQLQRHPVQTDLVGVSRYCANYAQHWCCPHHPEA